MLLFYSFNNLFGIEGSATELRFNDPVWLLWGDLNRAAIGYCALRLKIKYKSFSLATGRLQQSIGTSLLCKPMLRLIFMTDSIGEKFRNIHFN